MDLRPLLAAAAALAAAGPAQQAPMFRSATQTVPVYATVSDAQGHLVTRLGRDDFEIYDDDRPQTLTQFSNAVQPVNLVVMLDTSGSMLGNLGLLRDGAVQLFTHLLPGDRARVGNFGDTIALSPAFTSDLNELIRWVWTELAAGGQTPLWGAVNVAMTHLAHVDGRRVVVVFTDGRDTSLAGPTLKDVVQRAQTEEFMVYAIGLWSRMSTGALTVRSEPPDPGLRMLADETGGGYVELLSAEDLGPAFRQVADELHQQYLLGYAAPALDGRVHRIEVRVKTPGLKVRARKTYVASAR